jgi:hypothetical protein
LSPTGRSDPRLPLLATDDGEQQSAGSPGRS